MNLEDQPPALHAAIIFNEDLEKLQLILESVDSTQINERCSNGFTALIHACNLGRLEHARQLIAKGADVNTHSFHDRISALQCAVRSGCLELVKLLFQAGADINYRGNVYGDNLLHEAAKNALPNDDAMIIWLLSVIDHDIDALNNSGFTALRIAVENNSFDSHMAFIKVLLEKGADPNKPIRLLAGKTPFHLILSKQSQRCTATVEVFLQYQADVKKQDNLKNDALFHAVESCGIEIVQLIVDAAAKRDVHIHECHAMYRLYKCPCIVHKTNIFGNTALHLAAEQNENNTNIGVMKLLLERGLNPNVPNRAGVTPFHLVLQSGAMASVKLFVEYQADATRTDRYGVTALHYAACNDDLYAAQRILQSSGIDINKKCNVHGQTALHQACQLLNLELVRLLVDKGADVNVKDKVNRTPLCQTLAAAGPRDGYRMIRSRRSIEHPEARRAELVQFLLQSGSCLNQNSYSGDKSIFATAIENGRVGLNKILIQHMAKTEARMNKPLIDAYNMGVINSNPESKTHYETCQAELTAMKMRKISDTSISYFSVLANPSRVIAAYTRNSELVEAFKSSDYKETYPIYGEQLMQKFNRGIRRQQLFEMTSAIVVSDTSRFACLGSEIIEEIFSYLTLHDMEAIVKVAVEGAKN